MPQAKKLPKVELVELGHALPAGTTIDIGGRRTQLGGKELTHWVFLRIYSGMSAEDRGHFLLPTPEELKQRSEMGHTHFAVLDAESKEIVGATRAAFRDIPKRGLMMRIFYPPYKGLVGRTYIRGKFQRQGYAQSSKELIEEMARQKGVKTLRAIVYLKNRKSRGALKKAGFRPAILRSIWLQPDNLAYEPKETLSGNPYVVYQKKLGRRK